MRGRRTGVRFIEDEKGGKAGVVFDLREHRSDWDELCRIVLAVEQGSELQEADGVAKKGFRGKRGETPRRPARRGAPARPVRRRKPAAG